MTIADDIAIPLRDVPQHFPESRFTLSALRDAIRRGRLRAFRIGRRDYTTPQDIRAAFDLVVVYFIECGDYIKIGYTEELKQRVQALSAAIPYPITVLATMFGNWETEKSLHRRFASSRHKGEWFRKTPDLLAFIDQINSVEKAAA